MPSRTMATRSPASSWNRSSATWAWWFRRPEFLAELRRLTQQHGALLIYDEVMTGFRLAYGGAQELFGQKPDLTVLGKIVGGGLPVGAYGGRADIMKQGHAGRPGLPGRHAVGQSAGDGGRPGDACKSCAIIRPMRELEELGRDAGRRAGPGGAARRACRTRSARVGSMWTLFFAAEPVTDYDTAKKSDTARFARFFWAMMDRGVYLPCSQFEAAFISRRIPRSTSIETIDAAREALAEMGNLNVGRLGSPRRTIAQAASDGIHSAFTIPQSAHVRSLPGCESLRHRLGRAQFIDNAGLQHHAGDAGQDFQVGALVAAADQEEDVGQCAVGAPKGMPVEVRP